MISKDQVRITFHLTQPLYLLYLTYVPLLSTTFHMRMQHGVHPELQRRRLADLGPIWSRAPKARVRGVRARAPEENCEVPESQLSRCFR